MPLLVRKIWRLVQSKIWQSKKALSPKVTTMAAAAGAEDSSPGTQDPEDAVKISVSSPNTFQKTGQIDENALSPKVRTMAAAAGAEDSTPGTQDLEDAVKNSVKISVSSPKTLQKTGQIDENGHICESCGEIFRELGTGLNHEDRCKSKKVAKIRNKERSFKASERDGTEENQEYDAHED